MHRLLGLLMLVIALAVSGCQTSYLVGRGDAALSRGEPERAVADYVAALERSVTDREVTEAKLDRAALMLVERLVASTSTLTPDQARAALWPVLMADVWGSAPAKKALLDALEVIDRARWQEIEALATAGRFVPAMALASELVTPYPEGHPMRARLADLARRGQEHHLARAMTSGDPVLTWFHQRIGMVLGAPTPTAFSELERGLAARAAYTWRVEMDPRACPLLAQAVTDRLANSEQRGPVVTLKVARCREVDEAWSDREKRSYAEQVPSVRFIEEPYWSEERDPACDPEGCLRYDELGVCLERPPPPARCLEPAEKQLAVRQTPVIEYQRAEREIEVEVLRKKIEIEAAGSILFEGAPPAPFEAKQTYEDREFWSPAESHRFSGIDRAKVVEQALAQVTQALDRRVAEVRAERAISESGAGTSEALHVLAVSASRTVPAPAAAYFAQTYGMSEQQVLAVVGFAESPFVAAAPPARRELPAAELDAELDDFELSAVTRQQKVPGLALMAETGVDLAFSGGSSAFASADRWYGLEACLRVGRLLAAASGQSIALGGDVGGFALSLTGLSLDLNQAGFFFGWGLGFAQQTTEAQEVYRIFTIPISINVPLFSWLWAGASFEPNLLFTKTIFDKAEGDPHFWSPVKIWATFDLLQRAYFRAAAAHYLGAGFGDKPVQVELSLGVRL